MTIAWEDRRALDYRERLGWGWDPVDAAFSAYYGKPFRAILIISGRVAQLQGFLLTCKYHYPTKGRTR